jgi:hypothetical protein
MVENIIALVQVVEELIDFYTSSQKMSKCDGSYGCRQCGTHGDSIEFARKFLHRSFSQAVKLVTGIITLSNRPIQSSYKNIRIPYSALSYPPAHWVEYATDFVEQAHNNLLKIDEILTYLTHRGIPLEAVINAKIGWNSGVNYLKRTDWRLPEQQEENKNRNMLWISEGLIIPVGNVVKKRRVIDILTSNCAYRDGNIDVKLKPAFGELLKTVKTGNWCARQGSNLRPTD